MICQGCEEPLEVLSISIYIGWGEFVHVLCWADYSRTHPATITRIVDKVKSAV